MVRGFGSSSTVRIRRQNNNFIQGNYIGTDVTGTQELANSGDGILIENCANSLVGGAAPGTGNTISGNDGSGVRIVGGLAVENVVQGNYIGTDATGALALGNGDHGVAIDGGSRNIVDAGNLIALNLGDGVAVSSGADNSIFGNAIFANGGLGIDLTDDGVTTNDAGDTDAGANDLQNFPVISLTQMGASTRVAGSLDSLSDTTFTLDFYANSEVDPSGFGEGERWLGSINVTTDAGGDATFDQVLPAATAAGELVVATATDPDGNTSEFSAPNRPPTAAAGGPYTVDEGGSVTLDASTSIDPDQSAVALVYEWDFDYDGVTFDVDATGVMPVFDASLLDGPGTPTIAARVTDDGGLSDVATATVQINNVVPTAGIAAAAVAFRDTTHTFTFTANDPSPVDQAAAFGYAIDWDGDGTVDQTEPGSASIQLDHVFTEAGDFTVRVTTTDKDGGTSAAATHAITIEAIAPENLDEVIAGLGSTSETQVTLSDVTPSTINDFVAEVSMLPVRAPDEPVIDVVFNLDQGNFGAGEAVDVPLGYRLVINGNETSVVFEGSSPALTVRSGDVLVMDGVTFVNATNAPTILVEGGSLTIRNCTIRETTGGERAGIEILGGTVDLGTPTNAGGNVLDVSGPGELIRHGGPNSVSAVGNTWQQDNVQIADNYRIEDRIFHALDADGLGQVTYVAGNVYVTSASDSIQRGIDAVLAGGTVNVEDASLADYAVGDKLLTVDFHDGPTLTQEEDSLDATRRSVVINGSAGDDHVTFTPADVAGQYDVAIVGFPRGTFTPTGRLVAHGEDGDDTIQTAGIIGLAVWLYGDAGNDRLKGGAGHDVLLGGYGDDLLAGKSGRDLLIGGYGADRIIGNADDDILIAGTTTHAADPLALDNIMKEWTTDLASELRIDHLIHGTGLNGSVKLNGTTVLDDGFADKLTGSSGLDWFWFNEEEDNDRATDLKDEAFMADLDWILFE